METGTRTSSRIIEPVPGQAMTWYESIDREPWLVEHVVGTEGETHGNGLGDINGDGRCDIVTPVGWYEQPAGRKQRPVAFPRRLQVRGRVWFRRRVAPDPRPRRERRRAERYHHRALHTYGLAWLEQSKDGDGKRSFRQHWVETDYGQFHTMALGDLDGDGKADLVTGKRLFAHHGRDVSCYEPLFAFWYEIDGGPWRRHPLAFNHLAKMEDDKTRRNPPPNFVPAVGMKLNIADMDADGDQDIVVAGKGGLYVFYNEGPPQKAKPEHRLPKEDTYPSWVPWHNTVSATTSAKDKTMTYTLVRDEYGMTLKTPDGRVVFRYMTEKPADTKLTANSVCCLYPVETPAGVSVVEFAPSDHPHHRGVFLTWHAMEGRQPADFWGWGEWAPTTGRVIRNGSVELQKASPEEATIAVRNDWMVEDDVMIEEATSITAREEEAGYVIDLDFRLTPKADVVLKQTAFGGLCAKCQKTEDSYYTDPSGKVDRPAPHHLKPETDWPAKPWYDYTATLENGKTCGIAIVDHPENPPTAWHNLQAIAMLNPCIVAPGSVKMKEGEPLRLRYRLVVHDGAPPMKRLEKLAEDWRGT